MAKYELRLPKMGESVDEATLTAWLVQPGDRIAIDDGILEVSTDKVDTEIPSEVSGILLEQLFQVDDVVKVGEVMAIIETDDHIAPDEPLEEEKPIIDKTEAAAFIEKQITTHTTTDESSYEVQSGKHFLSPLVRSIVQKEHLSKAELDQIEGTGKNGRITKDDILAYVAQSRIAKRTEKPQNKGSGIQPGISVNSAIAANDDETLIPMSRMGKLIAEHMIHSVQTSAHVQSFIEIDVTKIVNWRKKVKDDFFQRKGEKLTFTPIFMHAVAQTIREFPDVNIRVEGQNIIRLKNIHLGMAAALPDGNLIVPVIHKADELSLTAMTRKVNELARKARQGKLSPDEIQGGTYTVTNVGSFGSITGTPIINQPQVAILALGAIRKMPAVIETSKGDFIGIRHQMIVAHSYDHRVVNGALGGQFILRLKEILENFDENQSI